jgi:hypothetical protein
MDQILQPPSKSELELWLTSIPNHEDHNGELEPTPKDHEGFSPQINL